MKIKTFEHIYLNESEMSCSFLTILEAEKCSIYAILCDLFSNNANAN